MNGNPGNEREELTMNWVKTQLEAMGRVEPPRSLKTRLEAGIPAGAAQEAIAYGIRSWWRRARWAGVAAAVVVAASAVTWLGTPWGPHRHVGVDTNNNPGRVYAADHNSVRPSDTNLCDINSLR